MADDLKALVDSYLKNTPEVVMPPWAIGEAHIDPRRQKNEISYVELDSIDTFFTDPQSLLAVPDRKQGTEGEGQELLLSLADKISQVFGVADRGGVTHRPQGTNSVITRLMELRMKLADSNLTVRTLFARGAMFGRWEALEQSLQSAQLDKEAATLRKEAGLQQAYGKGVGGAISGIGGLLGMLMDGNIAEIGRGAGSVAQGMQEARAAASQNQADMRQADSKVAQAVAQYASSNANATDASAQHAQQTYDAILQIMRSALEVINQTQMTFARNIAH
jgi:hypothetical protein